MLGSESTWHSLIKKKMIETEEKSCKMCRISEQICSRLFAVSGFLFILAMKFNHPSSKIPRQAA